MLIGVQSKIIQRCRSGESKFRVLILIRLPIFQVFQDAFVIGVSVAHMHTRQT